ncbi:MAG TPA: hypothetical protein PLW86_05590, partial [Rhodocyclaceae bacterium]|nr:hypothetical protein [Rhodocyclaceae bacterium]
VESRTVQATYAPGLYVPIIVMAIVSVFFAGFLIHAGWLKRTLHLPGAVLLGALTYPLYVLHQHIGYVLYQQAGLMGLEPAARLIVIVSVLLVAAWLINGQVERRLAPRLRRFLNPEKPAALSQQAAA